MEYLYVVFILVISGILSIPINLVFGFGFFLLFKLKASYD